MKRQLQMLEKAGTTDLMVRRGEKTIFFIKDENNIQQVVFKHRLNQKAFNQLEEIFDAFLENWENVVIKVSGLKVVLNNEKNRVEVDAENLNILELLSNEKKKS